MDISKIYNLVETGSKHDLKSALKRIKEEVAEYQESHLSKNEDHIDAAIEAGDVLYYLTYVFYRMAQELNMSPQQLIKVCETKVSSRRINGKNKKLERELVEKSLV
jgi:predicted ATP-grasp superfamily ATP-dependent carboligase